MMASRALPYTLRRAGHRLASKRASCQYNPLALAHQDLMVAPPPLQRQHQSRRLKSTLSVPPGAWDGHMHVAEPENFPPSTKAVYKVHSAPLPEAQKVAARLGLPNLVFVQTSTYGTDNAWILSCLSRVGKPHGRGVVVFDPDTVTQDQLRQWHDAGVRGVRINLTSVGAEMPPERFAALLRRHAELVRPLRTWVIDLYINLNVVPQLAPLAEELGVKLAVAHVGSPPGFAPDMRKYEGWDELVRLLESREDAFVKISAPYRSSSDEGWRDAEAAVKELMRIRGGDAVVFASDWPHTRFEDTDIKPWVDRCLEWCKGDEELARKLFRDNAKRLFDVTD